MQIAVMDAAERHRELITDPAPKCPRLTKPDMVGIRGSPAAEEARLRAHEVSMRLIPPSHRLDNTDCGMTILDCG